ncbi:MAG TPA: secondary thiamine-phosphate synthase enzyme YjbQ [Candidatus Limnocylindrales bacterium]|nr:secondary thiamine-phosphate synthase enzyme YjbQ [Candidatus Limnocylindrales bacterium]
MHHETLDITTKSKVGTTDITSRVRAAVTRAKVADGLCVVSVLHTTAGVFVNENADPDVQRDLLSHLAKLVPRDEDFRHAEGNSDAHIKAVLTGNAITIPIRDGELVLGTWQGIYFADYDGPRERRATVTVIAS